MPQLSAPSPGDYDRRFDTVDTIERLRGRMVDDAIRNIETVDHPAGFTVSPGQWVLCASGRHIQTNHVNEWFGRVSEVMVSNRGSHPIVRVTRYYEFKDLPTSHLSYGTRKDRVKSSIQGRHQLVRGPDKDCVWCKNIAELVYVGIVDPHNLSLKILGPGTRWTREDVEVHLIDGVKTNIELFQMVPGALKLDFCAPTCQHGRAYAAETQVVRWCEGCEQWYHVDCMQPRLSVEWYRKHPQPEEEVQEGLDLPEWLTWEEPDHPDPDVHTHFVGIITTPMQRCYRDVDTGTLLSFELLLEALRNEIMNECFALPLTREEYTSFLTAHVRPILLPPTDLALQVALSSLHKVAQRPLGERMLYRCPTGLPHIL